MDDGFLSAASGDDLTIQELVFRCAFIGCTDDDIKIYPCLSIAFSALDDSGAFLLGKKEVEHGR